MYEICWTSQTHENVELHLCIIFMSIFFCFFVFLFFAWIALWILAENGSVVTFKLNILFRIWDERQKKTHFQNIATSMLHVNWSAQFAIVNNSRITRAIQFQMKMMIQLGSLAFEFFVVWAARMWFCVANRRDKVIVQKSKTNQFYRRKIQAWRIYSSRLLCSGKYFELSFDSCKMSF